MIIHRAAIEQLDSRHRATLINSLAGFKQAVLVGTASQEGQTNLAIFNSLIHLGAHPPLYGLISRPDSVPRDTLQNIKETGSYTLNFIKSDQFGKAHQTSARYDNKTSEFDAIGFEAAFDSNIKAPFVKDAVVKIAMKLEELIPIPLNGTILIIGSVLQIQLDESILEDDGYVALSKADVLISQGLDAYFVAKPLGRLPYAKVRK